MPTTVTEEKRLRTSHPMQQAITAAFDPLPLENGARLSRVEFERRYAAMPDIKKAELIEGVVFMPSPVRHSHSVAHGQIMLWIGTYQAATPGLDFGDNATVRLDMDNEVQPDALLRIETASGGASRISADDFIEGAPELVIEIAASSVSYDLHAKKNVYRRNGVQEYVVWRVYDGVLDWFRLQEGEYTPQKARKDGVICSQIFPGLCLDVASLLAGDLRRVVAVVNAGVETEGYVAFVEQLAQRRA